MTDFFFAIGHFIEWLLAPVAKANWSLVIIFVIVLAGSAALWLFMETRYTRKAKDNNELI